MGAYTGPCASLLACFVSYSFSGLMQLGVSDWFEKPSFPESAADIWYADHALVPIV